jgi:U3 small nucleolar RNA-associated protein 14
MSLISIKVFPANYIVQVISIIIGNHRYFVDRDRVVYDQQTHKAIGYLDPDTEQIIMFDSDTSSNADSDTESDTESESSSHEYQYHRVDSQR